MISCPKCHGTVFQTGFDLCNKATIEFKDDRFTIAPVDNEEKKSLLRCHQCGEQYNLEDEHTMYMLTHPLIKCIKCGKEYTEQELDENHVCAICRVEEMDAGFANLEHADTTTLLRMLAQVRIDNLNLTKTNEQIQKRLDRAEEIEKEDAQPEEQPKKKRGGRKKKTEDVAQEQETDVIDLDANESNNNDSDIEIDDNTAPELPASVTEMSNEISQGVNE